MSSRRVVVTGIGTISPLGLNTEDTWKSLIAGQSGVTKITQFDASKHSSQIAAEVKGFDPETVVSKKDVRRYDRFSLLALAATDEAVSNADLENSSYERERMGVILGVGIGGLRYLEDNHISMHESGPRKVSPFLIPAMISNLGPGNIGIRHNLQGTNYTVTSACASGTHAVGEAFRLIRDGLHDVVVTGGSEAAITPLGVAGFARMKALSTRNDEPEKASRPFDKDRDGFVIGEGAAILVLEELQGALDRGANIIAEVTGYGFSCDAYHITSPLEDGSGAIRCMKMAIDMAGLNPDQVDYVNAHGTSTPINDPGETKAIKSVFKEYANNGLLVSSTKSMTGHALGAAGGLEAAFIAKAIQTNTVPPTINLENPDEGCDLDYVANKAREARVDVAMSNSFGFGGTNATILFQAYND